MDISNINSRVVLLLDLDCFYAQCETVRLGLDPSMPLCLLQWNSALAVNYPARERFNLKRGASFEEIRKVSGGECVALHLPVVSIAELNLRMKNTRNENENENENGEDEAPSNEESSLTSSSVEMAYNKEFNISLQERQALFSKEKNIMRHGSEGKASLDRYRLASARIFDVMLDALGEHVGKGNFILEKASIDELYIDVTKHCYDFGLPVWSCFKEEEEEEDPAKGSGSSTSSIVDTKSDVKEQLRVSLEDMAKNETIICAKTMIQLDSSDDGIRALQRGCIIARGIRKAVFDRLGFTLSAGVSTSKLVSKLCASYGKPNGQAVVFPEAIHHILMETKIRKTRNLGGKIGKAVLELLPKDEDTMGSIARLLTLEHLSSCLGSETGRMVWNSSNGIDDEPVKQTKGALTKSITSFKSFSVRSKEDLSKWVSLLSTDLLLRVDLDSSRNNRFPTVCTIQFYVRDESGKIIRVRFTTTRTRAVVTNFIISNDYSLMGSNSSKGASNRNGKSVRLPFPSGNNTSERNATLIKKVETLLHSNCEDVTKIVRLGLCAVNFQERAKKSIGSFFRLQNTTSCTTNSCTSQKIHDGLEDRNGVSDTKGDDDHLNTTKSPLASISHQEGGQEDGNPAKRPKFDVKGATRLDAPLVLNPDLAYAQKLQATYDRENKILSLTERKGNAIYRKNAPCSKKVRIETFFKPKGK